MQSQAEAWSFLAEVTNLQRWRPNFCVHAEAQNKVRKNEVLQCL